jgi:hypothetical protein
MGFMDKLKGLVGGHKDQAEQGIEKAPDVADEKIEGSRSAQIDLAADEGKEGIDNVGDEV